MSFDDETAFLAELDALLLTPPDDTREDDAELRELEAFAQSVRGRRTERPGRGSK